jgi:hypothetical protein
MILCNHSVRSHHTKPFILVTQTSSQDSQFYSVVLKSVSLKLLMLVYIQGKCKNDT